MDYVFSLVRRVIKTREQEKDCDVDRKKMIGSMRTKI
jgi:hypothetical protein